MEAYYAHSGLRSDKLDWQLLDEHLSNVARLASEFAAPFGASEWAYAAGMLHDQGKATHEFMRRLEGSSVPVNHSTAGGRLAEELYPVPEGTLLAPLVLGHHAGLANYFGTTLTGEELRHAKLLTSVYERLTGSRNGDLGTSLPYRYLLPEPSQAVMSNLVEVARRGGGGNEGSFFILFTVAHLLFGSLVDADWTDTERVMDPQAHAQRVAARAAQLSLRELNDRLDAHLVALAEGCADTPVNHARAEMLAMAREAASLPPGIFTLEMPTGAGKTLSSLSFALRHALANDRRRVIYAIPYMSIVDQTADTLRDIFGRESVVEHVSSYDYGYDPEAADDASQNTAARRERMLAQNWDAPVIVTTNVQLFESLFSNRVARSRKVHNIAGSVIVLDEVQTLPDVLLKPTLAMLETLVALAGVSVVLCTATQPSLDEVWPFGTCPTRIIADPSAYDGVFGGRVTFDVSHINQDAASLDWLVDGLASERQVLCIVSSRRAARQVYDALCDRVGDAEGIYHLSALMVPEHRSAVIAEVRRLLAAGDPVRVISTQLVEAGVDVDFPVVYRELAGIDSVLQAAGRCNREGRGKDPGRVVVFDCADFERSARVNRLGQMHELALETVGAACREGFDPFGPRAVRRYFERRYDVGGPDGLDGKKVFELIAGSASDDRKHRMRGRFNYQDIAFRYRFIAEDTVDLFVPWGGEGERLLAQVGTSGVTADLFSRVQRFTVSVPRYLYADYEAAGAIRHVDGFPVPIVETRQAAERLYDDERGLLRPGEGDIDALVI